MGRKREEVSLVAFMCNKIPLFKNFNRVSTSFDRISDSLFPAIEFQVNFLSRERKLASDLLHRRVFARTTDKRGVKGMSGR